VGGEDEVMPGRHSRYVVFIIAALACGGRSGERAADDRSSADSSAAAEDSMVEDTLMATDSIPASAAIETLSGRLVETGPDPGVVTLQLADGSSVNLVGDLESELRNLSGATVSVEGRRASDHPTLGTFDVYGYEISSIEGAKPEVGIFESNDTEWVLLINGEPVTLANVPDGLKTHDGARVWIIGERTRTRLTVQSYGIIRER
jgi:hypothetical protein